MSIKTFIGEDVIVNQSDDRIYVRLENDDLVDITDLMLDFDFLDDREVPGLLNILMRTVVNVEY